jgi:murein DD-endopeptidase MepM/ murein hydrolase activator NlpD
MQENNERKKVSAKKLVSYYLILAAVLLVAAAITVTLIFTVGKNNIEIDTPNDITQTPNDGSDDNSDDANAPSDDNQTNGENNGDSTDNNTGDNTNNPDQSANGNGEETPNVPTTTTSAYALPVDNVNLLTAYTFFHNETINTYQLHQGLDLAGEEGMPVYAVLDGTVLSVTRDDLLDGTIVTISHAGNLVSTYQFIDADESLKEGDTVKKGQQIGTIAAANGKERKMGSHLHFEMSEKGQNIDPEIYLELQDK